MRDDIEVQAERFGPAVRIAMDADFEEAVAHEGVLKQVPWQHHLEPFEVAGEMPFDPVTEIALPDVQRTPHGAKEMRRLEFRTVEGMWSKCPSASGTAGG